MPIFQLCVQKVATLDLAKMASLVFVNIGKSVRSARKKYFGDTFHVQQYSASGHRRTVDVLWRRANPIGLLRGHGLRRKFARTIKKLFGVSEDLPIDHGGPVGRRFERFPVSALKGSVVDRFDTVAGRFSPRLALDDGIRSFTYSELAVLVNDIAAATAAATAERPGPIAVLLANEARFPAAILGVLTAGRGCVPLDVEYPIERNRLIATHATAAAVVSAGRLAAEARELFPDLPVLDIETMPSAPNVTRRRPGPDDLAYLLYTSGSTGTPKGVYQNHRGLLHDVMQCTNTQHINCEDRIALFYSPTVISGFRIAISTLLVGASLHILPPRDLKPAGLVRAIRARGITIFRSVATLFRHVVEALGEDERLDSLRLVVLGGDRVDWSDFDMFKRGCPAGAHFGVHLGATECSTIYLQWYVDERMRATSLRLPVGRPVPDRKTMLLDEAGRPVADGEIGEFAVSSRYLALGYWQAPELAARFAADSADPQARVFRTGDLGRRRPDGLFEYAGRKDDQIKLHGHRIEPGEIESALKGCAGVRDAAIVIRRSKAGVPRSLVGYVELRPGVKRLPPRHLMALLAQRIPRRMMPSSLLVLDELPRLPSLKIDRARLAQMDFDRVGQAVNAPDNATVGDAPELLQSAKSTGGAAPDPEDQYVREMVVDALHKVIGALNDPKLALQLWDPTTNTLIADLGLDSLHSIEWCMEIQARSGVEVDPAELTTFGSVDELVGLIVDRRRHVGIEGNAPRLVRAPRDAPLPVSFAQERIWPYCQTPEGSAAYVMALSDHIFGPLDIPALRECLSYIVRRHEILRTTFAVVNAQPVQIIHAPEPVALPLFDLAPEADPEEGIERIIRAEMSRISDLNSRPLDALFAHPHPRRRAPVASHLSPYPLGREVNDIAAQRARAALQGQA